MSRKLQFFVAGLGRFGRSVAVTLEKMGYDVMAMDSDEDAVQDLSDRLGYVVCADCSDEKNLNAIGAGICGFVLGRISRKPKASASEDDAALTDQKQTSAS